MKPADQTKAFRSAHGMTRARLVTHRGRLAWTVSIGNACTIPTGDRNEAARRALKLRALVTAA
jgi:hypothetical protein